jgi:lipoprotein-releasing system permease protein
VQKYGIDFIEYESVAAEGKKHPEVLAAGPFTFNEAMLATGERGVGVLIKGVDPVLAGEVTGIEKNLCATFNKDRCEPFPEDSGVHLPGLLTQERGLPSLVIGAELLKKLGLPVGALVALTTPIGIAGARGNAPKRLEFRIGGVFRSGMHDFDARLIYLDLKSSQRLMGLGAAVNGVEFKVMDADRVELVANYVYNAIGRYPYRTLDWRELNGGIFAALKYQKIVMFLVLTFIIIVGAFNIASTLFMAVVEKSREIGVLKSMGARDASIMKIFVLEGWMVGGIGMLFGVVLGLIVCFVLAEAGISIAADVYMVGSLHVRLKVTEVLVTAVSALVISHLATIYPALNAARQRPVDAMRYE